MVKKISLLLFTIGSATLSATAQSATHIREFNKEYTTYPFSDPDPVPLQTALYPYFRFDGFTNEPVKKSWKVVELENDFVRLQILPEIGGKIWTAIEKSTGKPFFYDNAVIKFRDIAMRGPWTSGGLEANFGIIGHTPNCATPVDYLVRQNDDGSASCIIGVFELLSRSYWRMEIRLPKDQAVFSTSTTWYSSSPLEQPYYHWMNAGLKASDDLEFIYPGTQYLGHEGEHAPWPIDKDGHHLNWYRENNFGTYKSYHVFGKNADFSGAYWHKDNFGMVRYGRHEQKAGTKIWIWGLSNQGMIWEKLLSDNTGQYVELQSGRLFNQNGEGSSQTPFKHISFHPYGTDTWTEYWYPVKNTSGISKAADFGVVHLEIANGYLRWQVSANQPFTDSIIISNHNGIVYAKKINLSTLAVYRDSMPLQQAQPTNELRLLLPAHEFVYRTDPNDGDLARPLDAPASFDWESAFGRYTRGREALAMKNFAGAEQSFLAALQIDSNYLPALNAMSEVMYRKLLFKEALAYAKKALSIDTHQGASNYFYGLANEALNDETNAIDGFSIASLDPAWRSAALARLSRLQWKQGAKNRAIYNANQSLLTNALNIDALQLLAYYHRGSADANHYLTEILRIDPLNHFAAAEKDAIAGNRQFNQLQLVVRNELPIESWIERAAWYIEAGDTNTALALLKASPANAETKLLIAWLEKKPVNIGDLSLDFVFPYRAITWQAIQWQRQQQDHWKLRWLQALILREKNRADETLTLLSNNEETNWAPYYAFRAALPGNTASLADYEKAYSLDQSWRYLKAVSVAYNRYEQPKKAIALLTPYMSAHPKDYIMGLLYAKTLLIDGQFASADQILNKINVIPFEGATEGRDLFREAKLMQAIAAMRHKNYKKALTYINASRQWPERLGVGKPYGENIDQRLEQWLEYQCGLRTGKKDSDLLQRIIAYNAKKENTVRNFYPSNNWIVAKAEAALSGTNASPLPAPETADESNLRLLKALSEAGF